MGNKVGINKGNMGVLKLLSHNNVGVIAVRYRRGLGGRCWGNVGRLLINVREPGGMEERRGFHAAITRELNHAAFKALTIGVVHYQSRKAMTLLCSVESSGTLKCVVM